MPKESHTKNNRIRNQLVGLATLLLLIAFIMPWIVTDKSKSRMQTTPILNPAIVNSINQSNSIESTNSINNSDVSNNLSNSGSVDIPYITNDDSAIIDHNEVKQTVSDGKSYLIQLVALKNRQKIDELIALLRLNSYDVQAIPKNAAPDQLIKLVIGPYPKKEQAEQVIMDLHNLTKLTGILVTN